MWWVCRRLVAKCLLNFSFTRLDRDLDVKPIKWARSSYLLVYNMHKWYDKIWPHTYIMNFLSHMQALAFWFLVPCIWVYGCSVSLKKVTSWELRPRNFGDSLGLCGSRVVSSQSCGQETGIVSASSTAVEGAAATGVSAGGACCGTAGTLEPRSLRYRPIIMYIEVHVPGHGIIYFSYGCISIYTHTRVYIYKYTYIRGDVSK